jgi:hypothetical protein
LVLGVEAVKEFRIVNNNYTALHGTKSSGLVDVVSKSGTAAFHGSLYYFHRNDNLDARNFFDPGDAPEFKRHQFGASLGGPVIGDKTFFFLNYEGLRENKGETSRNVVPSIDARNGWLPNPLTGELELIDLAPDVRPYLDLYPVPNGTDFGNGTALWTGTAQRDVGEDFLTARIDHQLSSQDWMYGRYTFDESNAFLPFAGSPLPGFPKSNLGQDHIFTLEESHSFNPQILNVIRLGFNRRARLTAPAEPNPLGLSFSLLPGAALGSIRIGGIGTAGNSSRPYADLVQNTFQLTELLDVVRGRNVLKLGFDLRRIHLNDTLEVDTNGAAGFSSLRQLMLGEASFFRGVLPGADFARGLRFTQFGFFIQDSFTVSPRLTLNAGLRYEPWSNVSEANGKLPILLNPLEATGPESFVLSDQLFTSNPSLGNWAPRIGIAWNPQGDMKTVVRAGFGIFYDTPLNGDLIEVTTHAPPFVWPLLIRNAPFPDVGEGLTEDQITLNPNILEYDNFAWPSVTEYSLTLQRQVGSELVLTASYNGAKGTHILSSRELNSNVAEFLPDGTKFFPENASRKNPNLAGIKLQATDTNSWYNSLNLGLNKRFSGGFTVLGSYTFAKAMDEGVLQFIESSGNARYRMDSDDRSRDRALTAFDVRHSFAASFLWRLPHLVNGSSLTRVLASGWQLGGILNLATGHPFSPLISYNRSRSGADGTTQRADRPNLEAGAGGRLRTGDPDMWYDVGAFALPEAGFFGDLGRNALTGPGFSNLDFSISKTFPLGSLTEDSRVQFRLEFFNILNHPNFDLPGNSQSVTSASFVFTDASGKPNPAAARVLRTTNDAREIQLGLKVEW